MLGVDDSMHHGRRDKAHAVYRPPASYAYISLPLKMVILIFSTRLFAECRFASDGQSGKSMGYDSRLYGSTYGRRHFAEAAAK